MRMCKKCEVEKEESLFYKRKDGNKHLVCKSCTIINNAEKRLKKRGSRKVEDLPDEIWLWIAGYEDMFMVSCMGRVKGVERWIEAKSGYRKLISEKLLTGTPDKDGYLMVSLTKKTVTYVRRVNRLVGIAFIPNPENKPEVNHKKGIKKDNRVSELEWTTTAENHEHLYKVLGFKMPTGENHPTSLLIEITEPNGNSFKIKGINETSRRLGLGSSSIKRVLNGSKEEYLGYKFKYAG